MNNTPRGTSLFNLLLGYALPVVPEPVTDYHKFQIAELDFDVYIQTIGIEDDPCIGGILTQFYTNRPYQHYAFELRHMGESVNSVRGCHATLLNNQLPLRILCDCIYLRQDRDNISLKSYPRKYQDTYLMENLEFRGNEKWFLNGYKRKLTYSDFFKACQLDFQTLFDLERQIKHILYFSQ